MSVASVPAPKFDVVSARKEAHAFRGSVLNSYGRFEMAVTRLLDSARQEPAYATVARKPPLLLSQKLDMLGRISTAEGPWKAKLAPVVELLQDIRPYDDVRNLLSHGTLKVACGEVGETYYIFNMLRPGPTGLESYSRSFIVAEANALRSRINQLANTAAQSLGRITVPTQPIVRIIPIPA